MVGPDVAVSECLAKLAQGFYFPRDAMRACLLGALGRSNFDCQGVPE